VERFSQLLQRLNDSWRIRNVLFEMQPPIPREAGSFEPQRKASGAGHSA